MAILKTLPYVIQVLYHQDEYQANTFTNGGIVYIQNARPDGPAAWLVAEVSDRLLRWVCGGGAHQDGARHGLCAHDACSYPPEDAPQQRGTRQ